VTVRTLGDVLQTRRCEWRLKQRDLAGQLRVLARKIQAWEHDEAVPTPEEWARLAVILHLPPTVAEALPNSRPCGWEFPPSDAPTFPEPLTAGHRFAG
jgi:hypothetical protein